MDHRPEVPGHSSPPLKLRNRCGRRRKGTVAVRPRRGWCFGKRRTKSSLEGSFEQRVTDARPYPIAPPPSEVSTHRSGQGKVLRQRTLRAARAQHIQDRVDHLSKRLRARPAKAPARAKKRLNQGRLLIGQVLHIARGFIGAVLHPGPRAHKSSRSVTAAEMAHTKTDSSVQKMINTHEIVWISKGCRTA